MDRKTAEDLFPGKTYEFEGRQWRESGEVRTPKDGEIFLSYPSGEVSIRRGTGWTFREGVDKRTILTPVETSPRILTGYASDAKAGDVYEYNGERWRLVEHRLPVNGEMWIVFSSADTGVWGCVTDAPPTESWSPSKNRWIVEPYVEASPAPAVAVGTADDRKEFGTGAVRSKDKDGVRYDLISPIGLRRLAETYAEGASKYGDNNWKKGMPVGDVLNHAIAHIYAFIDGSRSEDDLAHAAWGLFTAMHFQETRPDMMEGLEPCTT